MRLSTLQRRGRPVGGGPEARRTQWLGPWRRLGSIHRSASQRHRHLFTGRSTNLILFSAYFSSCSFTATTTAATTAAAIQQQQLQQQEQPQQYSSNCSWIAKAENQETQDLGEEQILTVEQQPYHMCSWRNQTFCLAVSKATVCWQTNEDLFKKKKVLVKSYKAEGSKKQ